MFAIFGSLSLFIAYHVVNHYPPWVSFYNELMAAVALLLFACHFLMQQGQKLRVPIVAIFVLSWALIPIFQYLSGITSFSGDVWVVSLYLAGFALACCIGTWSADYYPDALKIFSILFVFIAIGSTGIALYQWFMLHGLGPWVSDARFGMRPYANLNQPNHLSTLLLFSWVLGHYLYLKNDIGRTCWWLLSLFLLLGAAIAHSETAFLIIVLFLMYLFFRLGSDTRPLDRVFICIQALAFVLLYLGAPLFNSEIMQAGLNASQPEAASGGNAMGRLIFWRTILAAIYHSPFWGYGWLQTSEAYLAMAPNMPPWRELAGYSHNLFLDLLVWNGVVVGGVILFAMLAWAVHRIYRCTNIESHFALCGIGVIVLHSMVEFPFAYTYFLFPVGFLVGLIDSKIAARFIFFPKSGLIGVLIVGAGLLGIVVRDYLHSESQFRSARFESAMIVNRGMPVEYTDAVILNQLSEFIAFVRTRATEGMSEADIEWMAKISRHYPSPAAMFRYTLALALNGHIEAARVELVRLRHVYGIERYREAIENIEIMTDKHPGLATVTEDMPMYEGARW